MARLIKFSFVVALAAALLGGGSYAVAWLAVGKLVGPRGPLGGRSVELAYSESRAGSNHSPGWIFTYGRSQLQHVREAKVYVSLTGDVTSTSPRDLARRIEAWEKTMKP